MELSTSAHTREATPKLPGRPKTEKNVDPKPYGTTDTGRNVKMTTTTIEQTERKPLQTTREDPKKLAVTVFVIFMTGQGLSSQQYTPNIVQILLRLIKSWFIQKKSQLVSVDFLLT